ncbi:MAG: hypothetical protein VR70_05865 [Rhodospirillaceae bacterium BRH_c57]|nr:MAG: hypothetical protein VR70_05865 [Rhodospirillaceae bacterium BRH_c57]
MATQGEVAEHLDLSDRSVRDLISRGVFSKTGRGALDLDACRVSYLRHLRERAAGRASDAAEAEGLNIEVERARLAKEQADHYAMKNAERRNELVEYAPWIDAIRQIIAMTQGRLRRVPGQVQGLDPKMKARIADALDDALEDLTLTRVEEELGRDGEDGGSEDD